MEKEIHMKIRFYITAALVLLAGPAFAGGTHGGGHGKAEKAIGKPGEPAQASRVIQVTMTETNDGRMVFQPDAIQVSAGETVRFAVRNAGELEHEFVLDDHAGIMDHKAMMEKMPEMEHDDPNSVRLDPGAEGEVVWTFGSTGEFQFACLIPGHYDSGMKGMLTVSGKVEANAADYVEGMVVKINDKQRKVTIRHEELKNLDMPAMTMVFRVEDEAIMTRLKKGSKIQFIAEKQQGKLVVVALK